jgi:hypothetical protein
MIQATGGVRSHVPIRFLECVGVVSAAIVTFQLAAPCPSGNTEHGENATWREKDWTFWWNAHQLYRRGPEQLTESQFEDVSEWCCCLRLITQAQAAGLSSLTLDECELVATALEDHCPELEQHVNSFPIYQACRRRLAKNDGHNQ